MSQSTDSTGATPRPTGAEGGAGSGGGRWGTGGTNGPAGARANLASVARRSIIKLGGGIANGIFGFVLVIVVSRGLGPAGTGAFFLGLALFTIVSNFAELGADDGLMRYIPRYRALGHTQDLRRVMQIALIPVAAIGTVFAVLLYVFAEPLGSFFTHGRHAADLVPYIHVLAPWLPLSAASTVIVSAGVGFGTVGPVVAVDNFGKPGVRPLLVYAVIAAGLGATAIALAWSIPIGVGLVVGGVWLARLTRRAERVDDYDRRAPVSPAGPMASEFWKFATPRAFASVFATIVAWVATLMLGALQGTKEAGVYAGASRYLIIGGLFVQALMLAIAPQISALLTTGDRRGARAVYQTVTVWAVMFTWPLYLALAVFSPLFLAILGQKFVVASTALTIGCFGVLVSMATGPISAVILMSGLSMWNLLNTIVGLGLNIGLSFWLIPSHGIDGAALASAISFSIYNFMGVAEIWFLLRLEPVGPGFGVVTAGATVCFGGLLLLARVLFGTDLPVFLVAGTIATLLYGVLILRFRHTLHLGALRDAMRARGLGRANGGPGEGSADGGRHRAKPRFDR